MEKYCRAGQASDDSILQRMRIAYCIPKATDMHSEYVTFNVFPLQQLLNERASMLRYTYIACIFLFPNFVIVSLNNTYATWKSLFKALCVYEAR